MSTLPPDLPVQRPRELVNSFYRRLYNSPNLLWPDSKISGVTHADGIQPQG
jgi:hypothetical protein